MTTTFLVDLVDEGNLPAQTAIAVRRSSALGGEPNGTLRRSLAELEIERRYWETRRVPFLIITERDVPKSVLKNAKFLHQFVTLDGIAFAQQVEEFAGHLHDRICAAPTANANTHARAFDKAMNLPSGSGIFLIWHCLATRRWNADLSQPLGVAMPVPIIATDVREKPQP